MVEQTMVYTYYGILCRNKKEQTIYTQQFNLQEFINEKKKKPIPKGHMLII